MPPVDHPQPSRLVRWLRGESSRSTLTVVVSILLAAPVVTVWLTREEQLRPYAWAVGCLTGWTVFAVLHAALTLVVCRRMSLAELRTMNRAEPGEPVVSKHTEAGPERVVEAVGEQIREGHRRWRRWSDRQNQAPSWSVQVSALALLVVAVILVTPDLRSSQTVLFAALAMVAACWTNVVVMFTVHYARLDGNDAGLAFPGEPAQDLTDYLYFALAVQSTFGTTDVEVRTRALRKAVAGQGALAFLFNSVIIAMIVSLLLGVAI